MTDAIISQEPAVDTRWFERLHRLREADQARPWLLDILITAAVCTLGLAGITKAGPPQDAFGAVAVPAMFVVVTAIAGSLPLVFRRQAPLTVFASLLLVCLIQLAQGVALRSDVAVLIALYTVCRYAPRPVALTAAVAGYTAPGLAVLRLAPLAHQRLLAFFFLCCAVTAAIATGVAARARQAQLSALAERAARLEIEREQRVRLAIVAERARVSREMHDIIGHNLAVITGLADASAALGRTDPARSTEMLHLIAGTSRHALDELRRTLGALREPADGIELSPQPGLGALPELLERVRAAGPQVTYTTTGDMARLTPGQQLTLYRILQEALTNTLKHAASHTTIGIDITVGPATVVLTVTDTGPPRPQPAAGVTTGHGLIGIRERAHLAGGAATAGPRRSGGWAVSATLPLWDRA
jgi:signal transduction histidine kinase